MQQIVILLLKSKASVRLIIPIVALMSSLIKSYSFSLEIGDFNMAESQILFFLS